MTLPTGDRATLTAAPSFIARLCQKLSQAFFSSVIWLKPALVSFAWAISMVEPSILSLGSQPGPGAWMSGVGLAGAELDVVWAPAIEANRSAGARTAVLIFQDMGSSSAERGGIPVLAEVMAPSIDARRQGRKLPRTPIMSSITRYLLRETAPIAASAVAPSDAPLPSFKTSCRLRPFGEADPFFIRPWERQAINPSNRIAFIGNSLPRRCGIATFTTHLQQAVAEARPLALTAIAAMTDAGRSCDYPASVGVEIRDDRLEDYVRAAEYLNKRQFDVICLQHEFGIFGGAAGRNVIELLSRLSAPIVTTLHTVLSEPVDAQRQTLQRIIELSARVVVMAGKGRELLRDVYQVPADKIVIIPHGVPDVVFAAPDAAKEVLGFNGRSVLLTFGLLSPNKGIEVMIDALPSILRGCPDVVYVVLGATHPNLIRDQGEAYRDALIARARALGVQDQVVFDNRFVDQATLLRYIAMCDVYVTPYLNEKQMTSGTLAYSFGLGKAVVSTPYWHAQDLLSEGRGVLVPFGDSEAIGDAISDLLSNDGKRDAMRNRAYATSRSMTWRRVAERYLGLFDGVGVGHRLRVISRPEAPATAPLDPMKIEPRTGHLKAMCDDTGLFQHAIHSVPDRDHGYCTDDNARALLLACALDAPGETALPAALTTRFASFLQHAWNPDRRRFRNFMSFDRRWLEEAGSEDAHGRALWALGEFARSSSSQSHRTWAAELFAQALGRRKPSPRRGPGPSFCWGSTAIARRGRTTGMPLACGWFWPIGWSACWWRWKVMIGSGSRRA